MDIYFEKISQLGTPYFRYIPVFKEEVRTRQMRYFYEGCEMFRKDLNVLDLDGYWRQFLQYYLLDTIIITPQDYSLRIYTLKNGVPFNIPSKFASLTVPANQGIRFGAEIEYIEANTGGGRMMEYIIFKGQFEFNRGSYLDSTWESFEI